MGHIDCTSFMSQNPIMIAVSLTGQEWGKPAILCTVNASSTATVDTNVQNSLLWTEIAYNHHCIHRFAVNILQQTILASRTTRTHAEGSSYQTIKNNWQIVIDNKLLWYETFTLNTILTCHDSVLHTTIL